MSNDPPRRRWYHVRPDPHAPVFVGDALDENENLTEVQLQRRLISFPTEMDLTHYIEHWSRRAIIEERRLSLENLPERFKAVLRNRSWLDFVATTPDTTATMNRTIVLEYYATLQSRLMFGWNADMGLKLRGVDVYLHAEWINSHYGTPNVPGEEDFFVYDSRTVKPQGDNSLLIYEMSKLFGPSNLWRTKLVTRDPVHEYTSGWGNVNVGKYIIVMIQNIARGIDGFGYAYFPFLITALARHFEVPEYDDDVISLPNALPIVYENEHPWFT